MILNDDIVRDSSGEGATHTSIAVPGRSISRRPVLGRPEHVTDIGSISAATHLNSNGRWRVSDAAGKGLLLMSLGVRFKGLPMPVVRYSRGSAGFCCSQRTDPAHPPSYPSRPRRYPHCDPARRWGKYQHHADTLSRSP